MKKFISFALSSLIGLNCVTIINVLNSTPVLAQTRRVFPEVYNVERNRHGLVIRSSDGIFYIGRSRDAIRQVNKQRYYGYWTYDGQCYNEDAHNVCYFVNINNTIYIFVLDTFGRDYIQL
jgi:hypothetical protein